MKSSAGNISKGDRVRFRLFEQVGCIVCAEFLQQYRQHQVHHLLSGGRRIGHEATIPLCPWHHQGIPLEGHTQLQTQDLLGPSLAHAPRGFRKRFGNDQSLLERTNGRLRRWN